MAKHLPCVGQGLNYRRCSLQGWTDVDECLATCFGGELAHSWNCQWPRLMQLIVYEDESTSKPTPHDSCPVSLEL